MPTHRTLAQRERRKFDDLEQPFLPSAGITNQSFAHLPLRYPFPAKFPSPYDIVLGRNSCSAKNDGALELPLVASGAVLFRKFLPFPTYGS